MAESVLLPAAERDPVLHSGGLAVPFVKDTPRLNKPPLIYWSQSLAVAILTGGDPRRDAIWMYRVPSLLAAIWAALVVWHLGRMMFSESVGCLAAIATAAAPVMTWEAHQARSDMLLLAITLTAVAALYRLWHAATSGTALTLRQRWTWPLLLWLCIALGILVKGPITPMVVGLTVLALSIVTRRWRWILTLRPLIGLALTTALVAPWIIAVARHVGFDRYAAIVHDEVLGRSVEPKEGHWGPPGYHLLVACVVLWPGIMLAGHALLRAIIEGRRDRLTLWQPHDPAILFCLAWLVPSWLVFELVSTKLPHYTMPLLPALAILGSAAAFRADRGQLVGVRDRLTRLGLGAWLAIGGIFILGVLALLSAVHSGSRPVWAQALITAATLLACLAAISLLIRAARSVSAGHYSAAQRWATFMMLPLYAVALHLLLPEPMGLSSRAWAALPQPDRARPLAMLEYHEDSMLFHTRGRISRLNPADFESWLAEHPQGLILARVARAREIKGLRTIATASGFNYSRGAHEDLVWLERAP